MNARILSLLCAAAAAWSGPAAAQRVDRLGPQVRKYLRVDTPEVILEHVEVIDGTGAAPLADRNVRISAGKIAAGIGGNLPGFGDQRQLELLVEAGFAPLEAIRIATLNGASFLGAQDRIGSIAVGKQADLVVVKGDPAARIADVENVEIVFKDGAGYDPKRLLDSVKGRYGEY
jgi:imidazolonepropionase-like amidohydrolase